MKAVEAVDAAQQFSKLLNDVHSHRESFTIVKRGVPYASLVPVPEEGCSSHEFAEALQGASLPPGERLAFADAIRKGRSALKPIKAPWG